MPIQKSEAIILGRQDLRETSLILTFYTKDFGKVKGVLRGVRGPHAQYSGASLEVFAYDEIVFYERRRSEFFTVSQCDLLEFFNPIRESLERLAYASYIVELLDSVTAVGEKNSDVFGLLLNSLRLLEGASSPRRVARIFEIKFLGLLGVMPALDMCANCSGKVDPSAAAQGAARFSFRHGGLICKSCLDADKEAISILPGTVKFIEHIKSSPFEKVARVKVAAEVGRELERILRRFLDYHIERRLKTLEFLKEVER